MALSTPPPPHASCGKQAGKGGKHSDPFIYNYSGVDLALFSIPARELK